MLAGIALAGPLRMNVGGPQIQAIGWHADTGRYASGLQLFSWRRPDRLDWDLGARLQISPLG